MPHAPLSPAPIACAAADVAETATESRRLGDLPQWRLDDLYPGPDSPELESDLDAALARAEAFAAEYKGTFADRLAGPDGGARLAEAIAAYEGLSELFGRLGSFATLHYVEDTTDPARSKLYGDVRDRLTAAGSHLLFFELELNRLDEDALAAGLADPKLAHYRPWLEDLAKEKPYQLADDLERLFHEKSVPANAAWQRLFTDTIAAMRVPVDGRPRLFEEALDQLLEPEEARRRAAAEGISTALKDESRVFTLITNTLVKDKEIGDRWRGFEDIADPRHLANRVEREVVEAMVEAVRAAHPQLSHRYYALKAGWLGKDRLDYWDRNAPLPDADTRVIGWDEARRTVLDAYAGFSPQMAGLAERFFERSWIDAPVREGKTPGAFSHPTVPSVHPYVLMNYQGRVRDVMTLAHELGHGVHQLLAAPHGPLMAQTPLTLAETASVFGEMLTFQRLLAAAPGDRERRIMLATKVEDMLNTVVRQIAFYSFERKIHTERRSGELTAGRIGEIWLEVQGDSLGPAIRLSEGYEVWWSYVSHFVNAPFYVYAYAFGDCLVNSLYAVYESAEEGFAEKYLDLLAAGGTKHHTELLAPFGLDARDPAFWRKGLGVIEAMIDELERAEG